MKKGNSFSKNIKNKENWPEIIEKLKNISN